MSARSILIVDDTPEAARAASRAFRNLGVPSVLTAQSFEMAERKLDQRHFDLVVSDLVLGEERFWGGLDLAKHLLHDRWYKPCPRDACNPDCTAFWLASTGIDGRTRLEFEHLAGGFLYDLDDRPWTEHAAYILEQFTPAPCATGN